MLTRDVLVPRLGMIRHLFELGDGQRAGRYPAVAVLCFHDALEIFLQIGLEHHEADSKERAEFLQLFDSLKAKVPTLENRDALKRVNDSRKVVKHKAIEITSKEVERCYDRTRAFLQQNSPTVFGLDLFTAVLSDSIADDKVRAVVKKAEAALEAGDLPESLTQAASAFDDLARRRGLVSKIAVETKVNLMAIGVEYERLLQFQRSTPTVYTAVSGKQTFSFRFTKMTREHCTFCIAFVVDVATGVERPQTA